MENLEDYNITTDLRRDALQLLQDTLTRGGRQDVPSSFWAFCQLADVACLERLATQPIQYINLLETASNQTIRLCRSWPTKAVYLTQTNDYLGQQRSTEGRRSTASSESSAASSTSSRASRASETKRGAQNVSKSLARSSTSANVVRK